VTLLVLAVLAVLDVSFAGFRSAAGRDGRIFKQAYYRQAISRGIGAGALLIVTLSLLAVGAFAVSSQPGHLYDELVAIARRLVWVFGVYALIVVAALGLYATAKPALRIAATVTILGPLTLVRPLLIVAATVWAVSASRDPLAISFAIVASGGVLFVERALDRAYGRR